MILVAGYLKYIILLFNKIGKHLKLKMFVQVYISKRTNISW